MNQKRNLTIFISCILFSSLVLSSCAGSPALVPSHVPTFSQTPLPTRTNVPSATTAMSATPIVDNKTIILTPEDVFSLPGLKAFSTPDSEDFCEHLPPPQIVTDPDRFSILSGRFVLCIREWTNMAVDLDTGSLVSTDDNSGDITMVNAPGGGDGNYGIVGWNNAHLSGAYVLENYANHSGANHLSYAYCENLLGDQTDRGATGVEQGEIACVRTTEGKIALLRVEKIYPPTILSVEFSFAVLRDE